MAGRNRHGPWLAAAAAILAALGTTVYLEGQTTDTSGQVTAAVADEHGGAFTADLVIRRRLLRDDGRQTAADTPDRMLRVERARSGQHWITRISLRNPVGPVVQARVGSRRLQNPFLVARWDLDESTGTTRMFTSEGKEIPPPSAADRRLLRLPAEAGGGWTPPRLAAAGVRPPTVAEGLVHRAGAASRRLRLEQQHGRPVGRIGQFDRYARTVNGTTRELLVDPVSALPAEFRLEQQGRVVSSTAFVHEPHPSGLIVRRRLTSRHVLPDPGSRDWSLIDVELSSFQAAQAGEE